MKPSQHPRRLPDVFLPVNPKRRTGKRLLHRHPHTNSGKLQEPDVVNPRRPETRSLEDFGPSDVIAKPRGLIVGAAIPPSRRRPDQEGAFGAGRVKKPDPGRFSSPLNPPGAIDPDP